MKGKKIFVLYFYNMAKKSRTKLAIVFFDDIHVYLTLYHTIPTFNDPEKESFWKHFWEKEKMLVTSIFSFSQNIFYPSENKC